MTLHLTNFFQGGYDSNQRKKELKEADFIARLMTHTSYIDPEGFARVNHRILGPAYHRPKKRLEDKGFLEIDRNFTIGVHPQGYRVKYDQIKLSDIERVATISEADIVRTTEDRIFLETGSQRLSLNRIDIDPVITNFLNIDFFRQMVDDRIAPIRVEEDMIITPAKTSRSILFYFLNPRTHHIIDDKTTVRARKASTLKPHVDSGNCFYYVNSQNKKFNVIGDPYMFREATAVTLLGQAISFYMKIKHKRWYSYIKTSNNREYHTLTNMPSWMKKFLLIDGKHIAESDMKNAQPTVWGVMSMKDMEEGKYDVWAGTALEGKQEYAVRVKLLRETLLLKVAAGEKKGSGRGYLGQHPENSGFQSEENKKVKTLSALRYHFQIEDNKRKIEQLNHSEGIYEFLDEENGKCGLYIDDTLFMVVPADYKDFLEVAGSGVFYNRLAELAGLPSRDDAKTATIKVAYDVVKNNEMNRVFEKGFPTIKKWIDWRKTTTNNQVFAKDCQREEADGWALAKDALYFEYDIAFDAVHDSVAYAEDLVDKVNEVLNKKLAKTYWLGFTIATKNYSNGL